MKNFRLKRTLLVVSFVCNNRCKLCGVLSPYYEKPPHFTAEEIQKTISSYFDVVSYVEKFTLSGGEPLLHPELAKIIGYMKKYRSQFGKLEVITNGKLLMKPELERELVELENVQLLIDDYGINSEQCRMLEAQAKKTGKIISDCLLLGQKGIFAFDHGEQWIRGLSREPLIGMNILISRQRNPLKRREER